MADVWVYKAYDANGGLLYVGVTGAGPSRLRAHRQHSGWAPLVESFEIEHWTDRETALHRERELIQSEHPRFNVTHRMRGEDDEVEVVAPDALPLEVGEMTVREAARRVALSVPAVLRAIRQGELLARDGHAIHEESLRAWVERYRVVPKRPGASMAHAEGRC